MGTGVDGGVGGGGDSSILAAVQWATLSTSRVVVRAGGAGVGGGTG